jgi:hypothetical protein
MSKAPAGWWLLSARTSPEMDSPPKTISVMSAAGSRPGDRRSGFIGGTPASYAALRVPLVELSACAHALAALLLEVLCVRQSSRGDELFRP